MFPTLFIPAEIPVLVGGAILPVPTVPTSTRISARQKRVQEHVSRVNIVATACRRLTLAHALGGTPGANGGGLVVMTPHLPALDRPQACILNMNS